MSIEIAGMEFSGDTTAEDWEEILGESYTSYVEPVSSKYASTPPPSDRNDIFRDEFNQAVGYKGQRDTAALTRFYSDRDSIFSRLLAFECGQQGILVNTFNAAVATANSADGARLNFSNHVLGRFTTEPVRVLDHGCGNCSFGLGVMLRDEKVTVAFYDALTPSRRLFLHGLVKYAPPSFVDRVWFCELGQDFEDGGPYAGVISHEVLEHIEDPVGELRRLYASMLPGGVLYMSTFFNSCGGHDPSHLDEHDRFQDTALWFKTVDDCGFRLLDVDPNGCEKIWEAT